MHEFRGEDHPLFHLDLLITAGCGPGFVNRLATYGVQVITTDETDPLAAVRQALTQADLSLRSGPRSS